MQVLSEVISSRAARHRSRPPCPATQGSAGRGDWRNRMGGDDAKTIYKERAATAECASAQARIACAAWTRSTPSRCGTLSPPTWSCTCRLMPELSYSYGVILSFGPADLLQLSARNPIEVDGENELYVFGRTCPCGHRNPVPRRQPAQTAWPPSWLARRDAPCIEGDALEVAEELGRVKIHCHSRPKGFRHADMSRFASAPPSLSRPQADAGTMSRASPAARCW